MKEERSVGMVLFREMKSAREYLLLRTNTFDKYWGLCKGGSEKNETETETALREVEEETRLVKIELISGFKEKSNYFFFKNEKKIYKEVVWFLGRVSDNHEGIISEEHSELVWLPYHKTLNKLTHDNDKAIVEKAERFLNP